MLDIDLGPGLVSFFLVFILLPVALAAVATTAMVRLIRNATRQLAVGVYVMLSCTLLAPAPMLWGDDHLGFTSSQAFEGYVALFWIVGAITTLQSLTLVLKRRLRLGLALGIIIATIVLCGLVLGGIGVAVTLVLMPTLGTIEVLLAIVWLAHRLAQGSAAIDWQWRG